jgi:hypothetical protein
LKLFEVGEEDLLFVSFPRISKFVFGFLDFLGLHISKSMEYLAQTNTLAISLLQIHCIRNSDLHNISRDTSGPFARRRCALPDFLTQKA